MKQNYINDNTLECLKGWCLTLWDLTQEQKELLLEAQNYKIKYAAVPRAYIHGLTSLLVFYINTDNLVDPLMPFMLHRSGVIMECSIIEDPDLDQYHILSPCTMTKDQAQVWEQFFREHEWQPKHPGLVSIICRFIKQSEGGLGMAIMQHASVIIYG